MSGWGIPLSKKSARTDAKRTYRSQLSRQLLVQYVLALILCAAGVVAFVFLAWGFCSMFVWHENSMLYIILCWFRDYILFWMGLMIVIGWLLISYHYLSKPLRYLDELVSASGQMAQAADQPVSLPPAMKNVQDELNLVRERALRSAMAAKEAEQRKNDLIVYLAHDLKTPLTSVIGYLSLLRDEPDISAPLRARYTGIALDKALRLEDLINEFFDITRFNLSELALELQQVDLRRMLEQICSEFEPVLAEKGLRCRLDLPQTLVCDCDPDKLARVFDNLLRNAAGYSFPDSVIEISGHMEKDRIVLMVLNFGRTIPPEKLERIFEQFFRLDSARSSASGGAGLGLAIARQIVERHGGSIRASSADNQVRFTVVLPVRNL